MADGNNFVSKVQRHAVGSLKCNAFVTKEKKKHHKTAYIANF
jgi:hypothetical protein